MKKYLKDFFTENEGVETIEFIALIAVAAALVVAIAGIGAKMTGKADGISTDLDTALDNITIDET